MYRKHLESIKTIRSFIDKLSACADDHEDDSVSRDAALLALRDLELITGWTEKARIHLQEMAVRYRQHGDLYGEVETCCCLVQHPECLKRCPYGLGEGARCRFHQLAGGDCKSEIGVSNG